jgi:hypothetical protein
MSASTPIEQNRDNEAPPDALNAFLNAYLQGAELRGAFLGGADLGENYAVTTMRDFSWDDITRFVTYWNRAI